MRIIACYSNKGGVGKTSAAVNLAYASAMSGKRTLLIDLDPQGASTFYYRIRSSKLRSDRDLVKVLKENESGVRGSIRESDFEGLHLLPASQSYRNFDVLLEGMKRSKRRLAEFVEAAGEGYQRIVLDCPPTMSLMAENLFRVADRILIPVVPTTLSERTYFQLKDVFKASDFKNRKLRPFFSMVEGRKRMHIDTMERMRLSEKRMLEAVIPYSAEVEAMGLRRAPLLSYAGTHAASLAFWKLWHEQEAI